MCVIKIIINEKIKFCGPEQEKTPNEVCPTQSRLKKGMRVLEIGAGTGRYSLAIAEQGFKVNAIELIDHNIDILKSKITENCSIDVRQGNA